VLDGIPSLYFKNDNRVSKIHPSFEITVRHKQEAGNTIGDKFVRCIISGNNISLLTVVSSPRNIPAKAQRRSVFMTVFMLNSKYVYKCPRTQFFGTCPANE
jgi:hypothetical protein